MATELTATGVITNVVSSECSVVEVEMDGVPKRFCFNKAIFYVFGVKCDGNLLNILEVGMEVNARYTLRKSQASIRTVWLGDMPDDVAIKAVYNKTGCVTQISGDNVIVKCDDSDHLVMINKLVFFCNGYPLSDKEELTITVGQAVAFDAIPFEKYRGECCASLQATCAWVGAKEPRLTDRFNFLLKEDDEFEDEQLSFREIDGTVVTIPNDVVALIDVATECVIGQVILFRSCFLGRYQRIQDVVAVGDTLRLSLRLACVYPDRKQWFVARAWKHCIPLKEDGEMETSLPSAIKRLGLSGVTKSRVDTKDEMVPPIYQLKDGQKGERSAETLYYDNWREPPRFSTSSSQVLFANPPLIGVIQRISAIAAYIVYEGSNIYVDRKDVYIKGSPCTPKEFHTLVSSGENQVRFEAVRSRESETVSFQDIGKMSYTAVRVWIGEKPSLRVVAGTLPPPKESLQKSNATFYGIVSKFCFPKVALLYVEEEDTTVCLHVRTFERNAGSDACIAKFIDLQQHVKFKIMMLDSSNILWAKDVLFISEAMFMSARKKWIKTTEKLPEDSAAISSRPQSTDSRSIDEGKVESQVAHRKEIWLPYEAVRFPSKKRGLLLNCRGALVPMSSKSSNIKVHHSLGYSSVIHEPVVYGANNDAPLDAVTLNTYNHRLIRFDAEVFEDPSREEYFCVKRMWEPSSTRPSSEQCLFYELVYEGPVNFLTDTIYSGKIQSMPLHDSAIAIVDNVPVLVTLDSLVISEKINQSYFDISQYLSEDDIVRLRIKKGNFPGKKSAKYFRATKCAKDVQVSDTHTEVEHNDERVVTSWQDVWGLGEYFCKGRVKFDVDRYVVSFVSLKRPDVSLTLDIFAKKKFFKDGKLMREEDVRDIEGCKITFHVAYSRQQEQDEPSTRGMYIACAWLGQEPSSLAVLADMLCDSSGSVCRNWNYEAVIKSFPLPTYMLCSIGPIPVVVPLTQITKAGEFCGVEESSCAIGDIITIRIQEMEFAGAKFLVANEMKAMTEYYDVFTFFTGKISSLPTPAGLIRMSNGESVVFELCHLFVAAFEAVGRDVGKIQLFMKKNGDLFSVGKEICFTACKFNGETATYRALRLWFKEEQMG